MFFERIEAVTDSGGAGRLRGGVGLHRDIRFVAEGELLSVIKKTRSAAAGRSPAATSPTRTRRRLPRHRAGARVGTKRLPVRPGDGFRVLTAGGGGYGDPRERDPEAVREDVRDGYVSAKRRGRCMASMSEHRTSARGASARAGAARPAAQPDGVTVEVVRNYLVSVAEEMRVTLVRTAFSPVIYEVLDFGISVYDARLELVAEAPGVTRFVGANDYAIRKGVDFVGRENLRQGDVVVLNYPYWSGAHTYDATLFAPVFDEPGSLPVAFLVVRAHWLDLGAKDPGYVLDSTDMHQEGLIFPGTKLVKAGRPDRSCST